MVLIHYNLKNVNDSYEIISTNNSDDKKLELNEELNTIEDLNSLFNGLDLYKMNILKLNKCNLSFLPDCFSMLNVTELDLRHNQFKFLPNCLNIGLCNVSVLNMSYNCISYVNFNPKCSKKLSYLDFSFNNLKNIPPFLNFENCQNLRFVNLSENAIGPFLNLDVFKNLFHLHLNNCKVSKLNIIYSIYDLKILEMANISRTNFNSLNAINFRKFVSKNTIIELNLSGLGLSKIDDNLNILINLQKLNLSKNNIYDLPKITIPNLIILNLSNNILTELNDLPSNLEQLFLSDNSLNNINIVSLLPKLKILDIYNNYIAEFPTDITSNFSHLDFEQNCFDTSILHDDYLNKRNNLRSIVSESVRFNGEKDFFDNVIPSSSSSSDCYDDDKTEDMTGIVKTENETEENWDDYETDDDLYLEPLKVFRVPRRNNYFYNDMLCDPSVFEDASEDTS